MNKQPQFAQVTVTPQTFERISGNRFWIYPQQVQNRLAVQAAAQVTPAAWSGTLVHAIPVTYQTPVALRPNNIGVQLTPSVVIP